MEHRIIDDFFVKEHIIHRHYNKIFTSCMMQLNLAINPDDICYLIIRRYQSGEVNSIRYADSFLMYPYDEECFVKNNSICFSTDSLGYGKSVRAVTYFVSVTVAYAYKGSKGVSYDVSETICVTTLDGKKISDIYKEV